MLVLGLSSCSRLVRPSRDIRPDTVGVVIPLSGQYQLVGEAALRGIRIAWQGTSLKLVVRDSKSDPAAAAEAVEEIAWKEGAVALVGGMVGEEALAIAKRADALGLPVITLSKAEDTTGEGPYVFRNMPTLKAQGEAIGRYASCHLGLRGFAVLAPEAPFAQELSQAFRGGVAEHSGEVKVESFYSPDQTTFRVEAQKLTGRFEPEKRPDFLKAQREIIENEDNPTKRRKALERLRMSLPPRVEFQALFLPDGWKTVSLIAPALAFEDLITNACDATDVERVRKTMKRDEVASATLLGWGGWSSPLDAQGTPELLSRAGKFVHCSVFVDAFHAGSARPATKSFVSRFQAAHPGTAPDLFAALAYDSAGMIRHVLEKTRPGDAKVFRDALAGLSSFEGATGTTSFDSERAAVKPFFYLKVEPTGIRELPATQECSPPVARKRTSKRPSTVAKSSR
jgi:branched-chain amino acid transport system substrate-binding protein